MSPHPAPRRVILLALLGGACLPPLTAASAQTAQDQAVALDAVRRLGLGRNLSLLAVQAGMRTQTYGMVAAQLGPDRAGALLTQHIQQAAPRYQEAWDRNLAAAHLERLTAPELASLAELGPRSPVVPKWMAEQGAIGTAMQARSSDLLQRMLAEVLAGIFQFMPRSP
ncbi:hypothetical protein [Falsiroseomonas sp.]|uniref:hypothetical protein n=1 Tax=Falsiroseomonas sp. TaxID=2870721 RepID=UPI003F6F1AF2